MYNQIIHAPQIKSTLWDSLIHKINLASSYLFSYTFNYFSFFVTGSKGSKFRDNLNQYTFQFLPWKLFTILFFLRCKLAKSRNSRLVSNIAIKMLLFKSLPIKIWGTSSTFISQSLDSKEFKIRGFLTLRNLRNPIGGLMSQAIGTKKGCVRMTSLFLEITVRQPCSCWLANTRAFNLILTQIGAHLGCASAG